MTARAVIVRMLFRALYLGLSGLGAVLATYPKIGLWGALISIVAAGMAAELKPFLGSDQRKTPIETPSVGGSEEAAKPTP